MKDLKDYQVVELNETELSSIEGGSWISRALDAIGDAFEWVFDNITGHPY